MVKTIGAFAPSDPVNEERLARLRRVEQLFAERHMRITYGRHALQTPPTRVPAELRARDFLDLYTKPEVDALVSICGGKNCEELLPLIDFGVIAATPKPVYGFSNACILLNALTVKTGLESYYGPESLNRFALSDQLIEGFISHRSASLELSIVDARTVTSGRARGKLFGGNLSSFVTGIVDTEYEPTSSEVVLFWESGSDDSRHLAMLLSRLSDARFCTRVAGMLIGQIGASSTTTDALEALLPVLRGFNIPTLYLPLFGHFRRANVVFPLGRDAMLDASAGQVVID